MGRLNPLNVRSRKQVMGAVGLLNSGKFRRSRAGTKTGKRLFNREVDSVRRRLKTLKMKTKRLPRKFSV